MAEHKKYELHAKDIIDLYQSYMPFVENGGLFILTDDDFSLGDEIEIELNLPDEKQPLLAQGIVVWILFKNSKNKSERPGVGVQLTGKNKNDIVKKIEDIITDYLNSDQPTRTI